MENSELTPPSGVTASLIFRQARTVAPTLSLASSLPLPRTSTSGTPCSAITKRSVAAGATSSRDCMGHGMRPTVVVGSIEASVQAESSALDVRWPRSGSYPSSLDLPGHFCQRQVLSTWPHLVPPGCCSRWSCRCRPLPAGRSGRRSPEVIPLLVGGLRCGGGRSRPFPSGCSGAQPPFVSLLSTGLGVGCQSSGATPRTSRWRACRCRSSPACTSYRSCSASAEARVAIRRTSRSGNRPRSPSRGGSAVVPPAIGPAPPGLADVRVLFGPKRGRAPPESRFRMHAIAAIAVRRRSHVTFERWLTLPSRC